MKKKVLSIILIILLLLVIALNIRKLILNKKIKDNAKIADKIVENITKDKETLVVLEINPKLALYLRNGKVSKYECLNNDCNKLSKDFIGKDLKDSVEFIYKDSKEKGFDVSKGVKIYSNEIIDLKLEYVTYEDIKEDGAKTTEEKTNLIDELKKDEDYGVYYECKEENYKTSCFIKDGIGLGSGVIPMQNYIDGTLTKLRGLARVLERFGIKTETIYEMGIQEEPAYYIYINGIKFASAGGDTLSETEYTGRYQCNDHWFKLGDLDLLNPGAIKEKYYNKSYADDDPFVSEFVSSSSENMKHGVTYGRKYVTRYECDNETQKRNVLFEGEVLYKYVGSSTVEITKEEYEYEFPTNELIKTFVDCNSWYDDLNDTMVYSNQTSKRYCKYKVDEESDWSYIEKEN